MHLCLADTAFEGLDYSLGIPFLTFGINATTAMLHIAIIRVFGVNGDRRFILEFTGLSVGFPSTPSVMEVIILDVGKSYTEVLT